MEISYVSRTGKHEGWNVLPLKLMCPLPPSAKPNFAKMRKAPAICPSCHVLTASGLSNCGIVWSLFLGCEVDNEVEGGSAAIVVVIVEDMMDCGVGEGLWDLLLVS